MQEGPNAKQLIAEKIKKSANILVTVSANPSVDALTAALGLSLMLNKLDKHASAVFSGVVPPAINFLEPGKTFENNVDSLRDFIIALDKEKADRLRYKVEDDVVRIFITPYRTKISEKDLQFSQGDFNVDLIIALGVEDQKDLDQAISAHGRILHDATVATINTGSQRSSLGSIDWQDKNASSLSEMLASMAETLKPGILDQQISTALLTGIVASTDRFSNQYTTPHVMTISAQLMAAGANQQLIASKLQSIPAPISPRKEKSKQQSSQKLAASSEESESTGAAGEMHIQHGEEEPEAEAPEPQPKPKQEEPEQAPEPEPEIPIAPPPAQNFNDLKEAIKEDTVQSAPQREMVKEPPTPGSHNINDETGDNGEDEPQTKPEEESYLASQPSWKGREIQPPSMGGTLNATAEQALEDKVRTETEEHRNRKILTHGGGEPEGQSAPKKPTAPVEAKPEPEQPELKPEPTQVSAPESVAPPELPVLPPLPPAPAPEPISPPPKEETVPEPEPEIPIAPPPLVVSEPKAPAQPAEPASSEASSTPALPPIPEPSTPPPAVHNGPTLEELEREAAHHAAQATIPQTLSELEASRKQANAAAESVQPSEPTSPPTAAPAVPATPPLPQPGNLPPMPDFSTLPPMPGAPAAQVPELPPLPLETPPAIPSQPSSPPQPSKPSAPPDPGQFQIPG